MSKAPAVNEVLRERAELGEVAEGWDSTSVVGANGNGGRTVGAGDFSGASCEFGSGFCPPASGASRAKPRAEVLGFIGDVESAPRGDVSGDPGGDTLFKCGGKWTPGDDEAFDDVKGKRGEDVEEAEEGEVKGGAVTHGMLPEGAVVKRNQLNERDPAVSWPSVVNVNVRSPRTLVRGYDGRTCLPQWRGIAMHA